MVLSERQRGFIEGMLQAGKSDSKTAHKAKVCRRTVSKIRESAKKAAPRKAKKRTIKPLQKRRAHLKRIALRITRDGDRTFPTFGSAAAIRQEYMKQGGAALSVRSVQRELRKSGLRSYVRGVVPTRDRQDLAARTHFLKEMKKKSPSYLRRIVWSDETWISTAERTSKRQYARRKSDTCSRERKCRWNYASVQVFGSVGVGWKSPLVFFPVTMDRDGETKPFRLNAKTYIRKCLSPIVAQLKGQNRVWQQDGARSHTAMRTMAFLSKKGVEQLSPSHPAYCPDLSAIETVWRMLHLAIGARNPTTLTDLLRVCAEEWQRLEQSKIDRVCGHFARQVREA